MSVEISLRMRLQLETTRVELELNCCEALFSISLSISTVLLVQTWQATFPLPLRQLAARLLAIYGKVITIYCLDDPRNDILYVTISSESLVIYRTLHAC